MLTEAAVVRRHARRRVMFAGHPAWARWGAFSARREDAFGPWGPCVCGICGLDMPDSQSKADHLRFEHRADVMFDVSDSGETLYSWRT